MADISTQAASVEAKLGYRWSDFSFGVNYLMGYGTGSQFGNKGDYKPTDMGVFLGYDLFFNISLFADYIFSAKTKIQSSENSSDFSGTGTRFGGIYSGFSWFSIVADVTSRTYTKYEGSSLSKSIKDSTTSVGMSFPIW